MLPKKRFRPLASGPSCVVGATQALHAHAPDLLHRCAGIFLLIFFITVRVCFLLIIFIMVRVLFGRWPLVSSPRGRLMALAVFMFVLSSGIYIQMALVVFTLFTFTFMLVLYSGICSRVELIVLTPIVFVFVLSSGIFIRVDGAGRPHARALLWGYGARRLDAHPLHARSLEWYFHLG